MSSVALIGSSGGGGATLGHTGTFCNKKSVRTIKDTYKNHFPTPVLDPICQLGVLFAHKPPSNVKWIVKMVFGIYFEHLFQVFRVVFCRVYRFCFRFCCLWNSKTPKRTCLVFHDFPGAQNMLILWFSLKKSAIHFNKETKWYCLLLVVDKCMEP